MKVFGDTKQIKKSSNSTTQNMNMIVDEKAFSILIDKLYSNKKYAIMREIASNAVDSHLAAGTNKPFDVTLPNINNKELIIRDYGAGLSFEDCYYYLGTVFGSKSQGADNLIGGFGLGSKSPFCLVSSYHITSVHKGLEHKFLYLREQNGIPQFIHLYTEETDKPSGIEFVIDVGKDVHGWVDVAVRNLSFFDIKPNFTNKKDIELLKPIKFCDELLLVEKSSNLFSDTCMVSMGGVVYGVPEYDYRKMISQCVDDARIKRPYDSVFIMDFEIGELDVSPSREHVEMTTKTKNAIQDKIRKIKSYKIQEKLLSTYLSNIEEFGYIIGEKTGIAKYYNGGNRPEIFTEDDYMEYPNIKNLLKGCEKRSIYDICNWLGITSYKENSAYKSYTTNFSNSGSYNVASVQSVHKRVIVNDMRISRNVVTNQLQEEVLVLKPKPHGVKETVFVATKILEYLHKKDFVVEVASEIGLKTAKRVYGKSGVDTSGYMVGVRDFGKNKVYERDLEKCEQIIYIECDGSYNKKYSVHKHITDIIIGGNEDYKDILPKTNIVRGNKKILLVTSNTIKKMAVDTDKDWFTYEQVKNIITESKPYISGICAYAVESLSRDYGIYRTYETEVTDTALPIYKEFILQYTTNFIDGYDSVDGKIPLSDLVSGFNFSKSNPLSMSNFVLSLNITVDKAEAIKYIAGIISDMTANDVFLYVNGKYEYR